VAALSSRIERATVSHPDSHGCALPFSRMSGNRRSAAGFAYLTRPYRSASTMAFGFFSGNEAR
jgi:hypothetical protein